MKSIFIHAYGTSGCIYFFLTAKRSLGGCTFSSIMLSPTASEADILSLSNLSMMCAKKKKARVIIENYCKGIKCKDIHSVIGYYGYFACSHSLRRFAFLSDASGKYRIVRCGNERKFAFLTMPQSKFFRKFLPLSV